MTHSDTLPARRGLLLDRLRLPVIAAPMFLVSGPEMVIGASRAGVVGTFPAANCRTSEDLDRWLADITQAIGNGDDRREGVAPWGINLVAHRLNKRFGADLELAVRHRTPLVITSLGGPREVVDAVHAYGGLVFADVVSVAQARKAAALGVDGLVLVCAGAGGHTGPLSPFAFVPAVRAFWDGEIVVGGGIHTGAAVRAALTLGADYAYVGTHFIASTESMAKPGYKQMLVDSDAEDIIVTDAFTGIRNSMLRPSIIAAGLNPDDIPLSARGKIDFDDPHNGAKAWRDIWSAGQGVGAVGMIEPIASQIATMAGQYRAVEPTP